MFVFALMCTIGCTKTETGLNASTDTTTLVENVNALAFDQDIEDLLSDAFTLNASSSKTDIQQPKRNLNLEIDMELATVTHDDENNRKTIYFDNDCSGLRGQSRTGTIVITYSEDKTFLAVSDKRHLMIFIIMVSK